MNRILLILSILIFNTQCVISQHENTENKLRVGAERTGEYFPLLKDKRVALLVNQTSLVGSTHLVDTLLSSGINVVKVFAPEHGFRGNAANGESIADAKDKKTGLPIVSLYGNNRKPTAEDLRDVDMVIFDVQDVGTRFYTYISSLHYLMEACAEQGKPLMILDRPNPNAEFVDGPIMEKEYTSFIGMDPLPILHGMTVGELAGMINKEGWLANGVMCNLIVILVENYTHRTKYSVPVHPSPNLPNDLSIQLYPSLCLFEGTDISVGRGTFQPFQQIGHPDMIMYSYYFIPQSIDSMSKYPPHEGQKCYGTLFTNDNALKGLDLSYLIKYYNQFPDKEKYFNDYFPKLAGTAALQKQIEEGWTDKAIRKSWEPGLGDFKKKRLEYLLYP